MPIFTYQCSACGLRFGAMQPAEAPRQTHPCKRCPQAATRKMGVGSVTFAHVPDAPQPQNTGASSVDHDLDVVIGRSAEENLRAFQARQDYKRSVISANETSGHYLSRLDDGEYFVLSEQQRVAAKKARLQHQDAVQRIDAWKRARRASSPEAAS